MGVVCAAYDPRLDRKVAVSTAAAAHRQRQGGPQARPPAARGPGDGPALAPKRRHRVRRRHPRRPGLHRHGFVQGVSLSRWLKRPLGWREVVAVFLAAGRGLAAAHRRGIVHGDFKPDNVIVDAEGRARILDFGLAFAQDRGRVGGAVGADSRQVDRTSASRPASPAPAP
ncbi:MAG: phosphotransferase [Gemmatimonadetes bacterium]|nr:phosphotransferase [Gemmatimonadota bacterium]